MMIRSIQESDYRLCIAIASWWSVYPLCRRSSWLSE